MITVFIHIDSVKSNTNKYCVIFFLPVVYSLNVNCKKDYSLHPKILDPSSGGTIKKSHSIANYNPNKLVG